jgi:hypothetical protein
MTRSEIRLRALAALNDPDGVATTASQVATSINEALEVLAEETSAITRTAYLALQPGTGYYYLDGIAPDLLAPLRIWGHPRETRLTPISMVELDDYMRTWPTATDTPRAWFPVSWDLLGIWPVPSAGGGVLRIDYAAWPRPLLDDDDEPEWPQADHDALVEYAVLEGLLQRWDARAAVEWWTRFQGRHRQARGRQATVLQARPWQGQPADRMSLTSGLEW